MITYLLGTLLGLVVAGCIGCAYEIGKTYGITRGWERRPEDWKQFSEGERK